MGQLLLSYVGVSTGVDLVLYLRLVFLVLG